MFRLTSLITYALKFVEFHRSSELYWTLLHRIELVHFVSHLFFQTYCFINSFFSFSTVIFATSVVYSKMSPGFCFVECINL